MLKALAVVVPEVQDGKKTRVVPGLYSSEADSTQHEEPAHEEVHGACKAPYSQTGKLFWSMIGRRPSQKTDGRVGR